MLWRTKIKEVGMAKVARELGVIHAAVRRYVFGQTFPTGDNMKALVALMKKELSSEEYEEFLKSLSGDSMGVELGSVGQ